MLEIRVLGDLTVTLNGRPLDLPARRGARLVLAWLALHPGTHPRVSLAGRFWPDVSDAQARQSLRTTLAALRRSLGPGADAYLLATREEIGLAGPGKVWVDAREFDERAAAGNLEQALDLSRGELLQDLTHDWVEEARREHREKLRDLLDRLARREPRTSPSEYEEAARNYESAAVAYGRLPSPNDERLAHLLLAGARMRLKAGQTAGVRETLLSAAELARRAGSARRLASVALGLGSIPHYPGSEPTDSTAVAIAEEALAKLDDGDRNLKAMLLAQLAREHLPSGEVERAEAFSAAAVNEARGSGDREALGLALQTRHLCLVGSTAFDSRRAVVDELVDATDGSGSPDLRLWGRIWRAVELLEAGERQAFRASAEGFAKLATELDRPPYAWWPALWRASEALLDGDLEEGERLANAAFALGWESQGEAAEAQLNAQLLWIRWRQGRLDELEHVVASRVERSPAVRVSRSALALIQAETGQTEEARAHCQAVLAEAVEPRRWDSQPLVTGALLAHACARTADADSAEALHRLLLPHARRFAVAGYACCCFGPVSTSLGLLETILGRNSDAERHFEDALADCELIESPSLRRQLAEARGVIEDE